MSGMLSRPTGMVWAWVFIHLSSDDQALMDP